MGLLNYSWILCINILHIHRKQTWSIEPRFHGFLETFANQKRSSVCGAMWDKGINLTLGALLSLCPRVAPQNRVAGMNALGSASFFLANTSVVTLCKFSLESVFYSCVNHLKYLAQVLGYWDNVSVCCYFNWTNQLLFWHDSKRLKVWNSKNYRLCVNIKTEAPSLPLRIKSIWHSAVRLHSP